MTRGGDIDGTDSSTSGKAAVVVVSGVSGVGKSVLCRDLPGTVLCLDDFYRSPSADLPRWCGKVDWEHPDTYDLDRAIEATERLVRDGRVDVPMFDIPTDTIVGSKAIELSGALVLAEGAWGPAVAARLGAVVTAHILVVRSPWRVAVGRFQRDIRLRNKSVGFALLRTARLLWREPGYRRWAISEGAIKLNMAQARDLITTLLTTGNRSRSANSTRPT